MCTAEGAKRDSSVNSSLLDILTGMSRGTSASELCAPSGPDPGVVVKSRPGIRAIMFFQSLIICIAPSSPQENLRRVLAWPLIVEAAIGSVSASVYVELCQIPSQA